MDITKQIPTEEERQGEERKTDEEIETGSLDGERIHERETD